jgi:hypothetical protein
VRIFGLHALDIGQANKHLQAPLKHLQGSSRSAQQAINFLAAIEAQFPKAKHRSNPVTIATCMSLSAWPEMARLLLV